MSDGLTFTIAGTDKCATCGHSFYRHAQFPITQVMVLSEQECDLKECSCPGFVRVKANPPFVDVELERLARGINPQPTTPEAVVHPTHYNSGKIEVWDFIIDQDLPYCLGDAVKYICRTGKKDSSKRVQDLEKAKQYIDREIRRIKEEEAGIIIEGNKKAFAAELPYGSH